VQRRDEHAPSAVRTVATLGFALVFVALPATGAAQQARSSPQALSARHLDAHADRVILVPTAETHPQGTLFGTVYELLIPSIGYAVTDRMQASITGLTDLENGFLELNLKANVLRSRALRIALATSADYIAGDDDGELLFGRAGGTAQICFDLPCRSSLSLHAMAVLHDELATILPIGLGAGFTAQVTRALSLLIEYSALVNAAREFEFVDLPLYLVGYGLRLALRPSWSLELSFLRSMESDSELRVGAPDLFEVIGVPFVAFSYRVKL